MGFNTKSTGDVSRKNGTGFFAKLQSDFEQFSKTLGDNEKSKRFLSLALGSLAFAILFLLCLFYSVSRNNALTESLGELRLLSQVISRQAVEVTTGKDELKLQDLQDSKARFDKNLKVVSNTHSSSKELKNIEEIWKNTSEQINIIVKEQDMVGRLANANIDIAAAVPNIQGNYNQLATSLINQGIAGSQVALTKDQVAISERILSTSNSLATSTLSAVDAAKAFEVAKAEFKSTLNGQLNGDMGRGILRVTTEPDRDRLMEIKKEFDAINKATDFLSNKADQEKVIGLRNASNMISSSSDSLLPDLNKLSGSNLWTFIFAGLIILALMSLLFWVFKLLALRSDADKVRVTRLQDEYDRNQNAILRLLDEIADLADGDLRSYATVSEDFTGAIADSINFAIDQLRDLVSRINETSQEVSRYSQDTQNSTNQLAEASEHQAQEIAGDSAAINEMAMSIDQVSSNATESADVAQRSVKIASNGADVVNRSIEGMDTIREQIQETSKRIKRLGESSQEIGNIVSLINDIADQTNILALNAAIQASMAGEAGRGFAVVADEVQRLAERSTSATKQIETLVKTIQTDTNEAVISMEQTTSEVVRGANLAKDAGVALDEIQKVSNDLAKLIASISDAAKLQSASASHIATTMNVVQEITSQTTGATFDTARSVSELANMAESLRESVTDFKLPE